MARPTGSADLPLHAGRVPAWLGGRMSVLRAVTLDGRSMLGWKSDGAAAGSRRRSR